MKLILALFSLLLTCSCFAQKNSATIYGVGNFNPTTLLILTAQNDNTMVSFNRSSFGGALEYDHWFVPSFSLGAIYEENPSDIKFLLSDGKFSIDPHLTHFEMLPILTEKKPIGSEYIFLQQGAGAIVTYGPQPGWSHDLAWAFGGGIEKPIAKNMSLVAGTLFLASETGCYGDHTCKASWGIAQDAHVGFKVSW